ncbi:hypothetical protein EYR40_002958 [Pleurotus pulmonarius]|nr:hypothetical protein EYR40_002958 [Pleurotus pulmonarius]
MAGRIQDLSSRVPLEANLAPNLALIAVFDFTQIIGFVLLVIVLLSARLAPTVHRSPAWFNFLFTWVLYCVSYLITLGQQTGEEPDFSVCLLQAMLIYAAPAVTVTAGLCFSIEMWRIITHAGLPLERGASSFRDYGAMVVAPYFVHLTICIEVLVLGLKDRRLVKRDRTFAFCHLESTLPHIAASRLWQGLQVSNAQKMVIRFGIFTVLPVLGLAISVAQVTVKSSPIADGILNIAIGTLPAGAALIFGTQSSASIQLDSTVMPSQNQAGSSPPNISLIVIFDFTQILGFVLLCIVLLTAALVTTLIVAPYVVHLIICIEVLVLGLRRRELVTRDKTHMFCHLDSALPAYVTGSVVICAIVIAMAFVASTAIHIRKHMAASRLFQGQQVANIQKMVIRFAIFTVLPVFGLALSVAQVSARPTGVADGILTIAIGTLPAGAALIFGTQSDLMRVWCFWRRSTMSKNPLEASARKTSQSV